MANRFWVGGNGNWSDATNHWATTSGGAPGVGNLPTSSDVAKFDAASTGTCTLDQDITIQGLDLSAANAAGCGLDASAGSHNVTTTGATGLANSGTGTRVLKMGGGTWTITASNGNGFNQATTTGLTFQANSSTIVIAADPVAAHQMTFAGGGLTYNNLTINANANGDGVIFTGSNTFATVTLIAPLALVVAATTQTMTTLTYSGGGPTSLTSIMGTNPSSIGTLTVTNNSAGNWVAYRCMTFSGAGSATATNSWDLGANAGITITPPSSGSGTHFVGG